MNYPVVDQRIKKWPNPPLWNVIRFRFDDFRILNWVHDHALNVLKDFDYEWGKDYLGDTFWLEISDEHLLSLFILTWVSDDATFRY